MSINHFKTSFVQKHHHFKELDSTNTYAIKLAQDGAPEGTIVTAETQLKGRGQRQRIWQSPRGKGLYYSLILRPDIHNDQVFVMTLMAGLAVFDTVRVGYRIIPALKWPNDVLINDKKVAGILTESVWLSNKLEFIVIGVGINLHFEESDFPERPVFPPTSLHRESSERLPFENIIELLSNKFDLWLRRLKYFGVNEILQQWSWRSPLIGQEIIIDCLDTSYRGIVRGLDDRGAILLDTVSNGLISLYSGTISAISDSPSRNMPKKGDNYADCG